jgi:hypothetical protein
MDNIKCSEWKSGCETFLNNLNSKSNWLKENIIKWQLMIKYWWDKVNLTDYGNNIANWHRFNNNSYNSDKLRVSDRQKNIMNQFHSDPYYIFKNMVEIMWRDLVSKFLRKELSEKLTHEDSRLQVFITSDYDDVFAWVDLICKIETEDGVDYLWVDIAVSNNQEYLIDKSLKKVETYCTEFNLKNWLNPKFNIPRQVLQLKPEIMAEMLSRYLTWVEEWLYVDTLELYNNITKEKINDVSDNTSFKIDNLLTIQ